MLCFLPLDLLFASTARLQTEGIRRSTAPHHHSRSAALRLGPSATEGQSLAGDVGGDPFRLSPVASRPRLRPLRTGRRPCIHNMRVKFGYLECYLEYIDYPGEKKEWVRVFRKNSARSNQNSRESTQIMIRPSFPKWYFVHEVPEQLPNSDVTAIVDETWKIGDLVDWLKEGCYWSATITKLLNEDLVEVELPAPPIGEGQCYQANCSDLRPTLEWSLAKGWTVPLSQANGKGWHAARLLQHYKSESDDENDDNDSWDARKPLCRASNTPEEAPGPIATNSASSHIYQKDTTVTSTEDLKPSSTSKSPDPSHDAQAAATSSQTAGIGISIKQEPVIGVSIKQEESSLTEGEVDGGLEECVEKLGTIKARLKYLMQGTRLERQSFRGYSSGK